MPAGQCDKWEELVRAVQGHLEELSRLTRAAAEIAHTSNENTLYALDAQIEQVLALQKKAMQALRRHKKEHGC